LDRLQPPTSVTSCTLDFDVIASHHQQYTMTSTTSAEAPTVSIDTLVDGLETTPDPTPKNNDPVDRRNSQQQMLPKGFLAFRRPSSPTLPRLSFSVQSSRLTDGGQPQSANSLYWAAAQFECASVTSIPDSNAQWIPHTPLTAVTGRSPPTFAELQATAGDLGCLGDSFDAMLLVPAAQLPPLPPPLLAHLPS
jgi:hypothetical protein